MKKTYLIKYDTKARKFQYKVSPSMCVSSLEKRIEKHIKYEIQYS